LDQRLNGGEDMYFPNSDGKYYKFYYRNKFYEAGTKFIYNGSCLSDGKEVFLNNQVCEYLYVENLTTYFKCNENIYTCKWEEFKWHICGIIEEKIEPPPIMQETVFYWTDEMVTKTIWYIVIMLAATIFYDRIGIWILATIVWYISTFKKKN
jgi:hypothetical protein